MEHTDHHVGRLIDALEDLGDPRRHARLLHRRRQRGIRRGDAEWHLQRADDAQWRRRRSRRPSSWPPGSTSSARRRRTTTTPSAGRTRWIRPTSGPSRSRRTGEARATAPSSTGRPASRPRARCGTQFSHVIDIAPTVLDVGRPAGALLRARDPADAIRRASHAPPRSTTRRQPNDRRPSTSRCSSTAASTTRAGPR